MQAQLLNFPYQQDLKQLMSQIGVDRYGVKIMHPKSIFRVIRLSQVSSFSANILKQEVLSLGGDLAIPREALLKNKLVECVLIVTQSQLEKLLLKLKPQPRFLREVGVLIKEVLDNFQRNSFTLLAGRRKISLAKTSIMGILNLTPDSFSGDGLLGLSQSSQDLESRIRFKVEGMVRDGVSMIDIGGESTRPGAQPLRLKQELQRITPALKVLRRYFPKIPVSIDTYKPQVAKAALDQGACIVNDITALKSEKMAHLISKEKAGVVLMHSKGEPLTMQRNPCYKDVLSEVYGFLGKAVKRAESFGIARQRIVVDVGIGFGKRVEDNLKLIRHLYQFKSLGLPVLIGLSRKSFIGKVLGDRDPSQRLSGTLAALVITVMNGVKILRVHDVAEAKSAVKLVQGVMGL